MYSVIIFLTMLGVVGNANGIPTEKVKTKHIYTYFDERVIVPKESVIYLSKKKKRY
jgi:hypothetical protein